MHWTKTNAGYTLDTPKGIAEIHKDARKGWVLDYCGDRIGLGRRASFDRAEAHILRCLHETRPRKTLEI